MRKVEHEVIKTDESGVTTPLRRNWNGALNLNCASVITRRGFGEFSIYLFAGSTWKYRFVSLKNLLFTTARGWMANVEHALLTSWMK